MGRFVTSLSRGIGFLFSKFPKTGFALIAVLAVVSIVRAEGILDFFSDREVRTPEQIYELSVDGFNDYLIGSYLPYIELLEAERDLSVYKGKDQFGTNASESIRLANKVEYLEAQIKKIRDGKLIPVLTFEERIDPPEEAGVASADKEEGKSNGVQ